MELTITIIRSPDQRPGPDHGGLTALKFSANSNTPPPIIPPQNPPLPAPLTTPVVLSSWLGGLVLQFERFTERVYNVYCFRKGLQTVHGLHRKPITDSRRLLKGFHNGGCYKIFSGFTKSYRAYRDRGFPGSL